MAITSRRSSLISKQKSSLQIKTYLLLLIVLVGSVSQVKSISVEPSLIEFRDNVVATYTEHRIIITNDSNDAGKADIAGLLNSHEINNGNLGRKVTSINIETIAPNCKSEQGSLSCHIRRNEVDIETAEDQLSENDTAADRHNGDQGTRTQILSNSNAAELGQRININKESYETLIRLNPVRHDRKPNPNSKNKFNSDQNSGHDDFILKSSFGDSTNNVLKPGESAYLDIRFIPSSVRSYDEDFLISWQESIIKRSSDGQVSTFKNYGDISYKTVKVKGNSVHNEFLPHYVYNYFFPGDQVISSTSDTLSGSAAIGAKAKQVEKTIHYNSTNAVPVYFYNPKNISIEIKKIFSSSPTLQLEWKPTQQEMSIESALKKEMAETEKVVPTSASNPNVKEKWDSEMRFKAMSADNWKVKPYGYNQLFYFTYSPHNLDMLMSKEPRMLDHMSDVNNKVQKCYINIEFDEYYPETLTKPKTIKTTKLVLPINVKVSTNFGVFPMNEIINFGVLIDPSTYGNFKTEEDLVTNAGKKEFINMNFFEKINIRAHYAPFNDNNSSSVERLVNVKGTRKIDVLVFTTCRPNSKDSIDLNKNKLVFDHKSRIKFDHNTDLIPYPSSSKLSVPCKSFNHNDLIKLGSLTFNGKGHSGEIFGEFKSNEVQFENLKFRYTGKVYSGQGIKLDFNDLYFDVRIRG